MAHGGGRLWGGRFDEQPTEQVIAFMAGRDVAALPACDEILIPYDIAVNRAHATMLGETGIIPAESARRILDGLDALEADYHAGQFGLDPSLEDVHTNIERALAERIGEEHAAHVHTARSRNDQSLCDLRLWQMDAAAALLAEVREAAETLLAVGLEHTGTVLPGFTHHQHATVTTLGHVLVGFAPSLVRACERLAEWRVRFDRCPLGAAASYGTTFPIDRERVADLLGFAGVEESTLDPLQTRGEPEAELVGILDLALAHLSALAASLILLATDEFGVLRIADGYSSGSSIMPQKRNPDALEVIKARAATVSGLATALRSLAARSLFGYNREQQWSKYLVMDAVREGLPCFGVVSGVLRTLSVSKERARELAGRGFLSATAVVEALCGDFGLGFRTAKAITERAVSLSAAEGAVAVTGNALRAALAEAGRSETVSDDWVRSRQDPDVVLAELKHVGAPGPAAVTASAAVVRTRLAGVQVPPVPSRFRAG